MPNNNNGLKEEIIKHPTILMLNSINRFKEMKSKLLLIKMLNKVMIIKLLKIQIISKIINYIYFKVTQ